MKKDMPKSNPHLRAFIHAETGGLCIYCGRQVTLKEFTMDHIVPKKGNGKGRKENLVCCCAACNALKGSMTIRAFRASMDPEQRRQMNTRINELYRGRFIGADKKELLMGRVLMESYRRTFHFSTLLFDIHVELMFRRKD